MSFQSLIFYTGNGHHYLEKIIKSAVVCTIYGESERSGKPVLCIVDDTIASKTKPLSQALHPVESAYFHQSHLKKKQDYRHQTISIMLSCSGITLNYAIIMYEKIKSKIQLMCDLAQEFPVPPVASYFLCDCWYTTGKVMDAFLKRGFYTVGALKTNRIIYPLGIRQPLHRFASHLRKSDCAVRLVTVGKRQFYVYRYERPLNGVEDAVVTISWSKEAFLVPRALRAFLCTDTSLTTQRVLELYTERWAIEVYFRQRKAFRRFLKEIIGMVKILFVCHGNICRSAMAEYIMKYLVKERGLSDQFYIESAATSREEIGCDLYPDAKRTLRDHGIPFSRHYARQITRKDYDLFDWIFVMDRNNQKNIRRIIPANPDHKIHLLNPGQPVEDPWYTGRFEKVYQEILEGCTRFLDGNTWLANEKAE